MQGLSALIHLESLQLRMVRYVNNMLGALWTVRPPLPFTRLLIELPVVCGCLSFIPMHWCLSGLMSSAVGSSLQVGTTGSNNWNRWFWFWFWFSAL